jgi:hypothetical protein
MVARGREQDVTDGRLISLVGHAYGERRVLIQPGCHTTGELFVHVLNDYDRDRKVLRQMVQDHRQDRRPSC